MSVLRRVFLIGVCVLSFAGALRAAEVKGVKLLYSFEPDEAKSRVRGKVLAGDASHGQYSLHIKLRKGGRMARSCGISPDPNHMKELPQFMAMPPSDDYHDIMQWFFERYCSIFDESGVANQMQGPPKDWTSYESLRFDVYAKDAPVILGFSVRDATGPKYRVGYTGVRSGYGIFKVPKGKWVTCDFPLRKMARLGGVDLKKALGFFLHFNGFQGATPLRIDYFRLVTADGEKPPKHELIAPCNKLTARLYKVVKTPPLKKIPEKLKRDTSPVEKLGPITITNRGGFGGIGITYVNTTRRGVICYDNNRMLFLSRGGGDAKLSRKVNPKSVGARGIYAHATFDGGKTWGGMAPGEELPTHLNTWYGRAGASTDYETGQVFYVGTENCQSYRGGYDTYFRTLGFTGGEWALERVAMIDNNMQKCPWWSRVVRTKSGRLWACWGEGRSTYKFYFRTSMGYPCAGFPAKYSDDGGLTWVPCRDGDSTQIPQPPYKPALKDMAVAHEKAPEKVIFRPVPTLIPGPMMTPYKGGVASISPRGERWAAHDGKEWDVKVHDFSHDKKWKGIPKLGKHDRYAECTVTTVEDKHIFVAKGGNNYAGWYIRAIKDRGFTVAKMEDIIQTDLTVARYDGDTGKWSLATLETAGVWESILTASGNAVFCFYVKVEQKGDAPKTWVLYYRRWKDGQWSDAVKLYVDKVRMGRLAAAQRCPSSYAAIFWSHKILRKERARDSIMFIKVPNK